MNSTPTTTKDPGSKKNDGYSKQVAPEKIVNEQDQDKISNNQRSPVTAEQSEETSKPEVIENPDGELSDKATEESEHITPETLEEDRKHQSGINA
ncbi:hypothetical protein [Flavitalea sp.]|nr:hypothetical protein [Flavitalea sp.]